MHDGFQCPRCVANVPAVYRHMGFLKRLHPRRLEESWKVFAGVCLLLVPKDKLCASTHLGDMHNRVAALFVMSNALVFVSTVIGTGGLSDEGGAR